MLRLAECKRNIWLEFSAQRLILMPAILGGILFLVHLLNEDAEILAYVESMTGRITTLYVLVVLVWGTVLVSRNINEELMQHSWDFQRMSSLSGIEMMLGKAFGATAYAWYGGLLLIGAHIGIEIYGDIPTHIIASNVAHFLLAGMFAHAAVLLCALLMLRNPAYRAKPRGRILYSILVLAYTLPMLFMRDVYDQLETIPGDAAAEWATTTWYGITLPLESWTLISFAVFTLWVLFAAVRMMSAELQYRQTSLGWPLFLLFCIAWYGGSEWSPEDTLPIASVPIQSYYALGITAVGLYVSMLFDRVGIADYRKWFHAMRTRRWGDVATQIPWWLSSYILLLPSVAVALYYGLEGDENTKHAWQFAGLLLAVTSRDIALYHALAFAGMRRLLGSFLVYLAMLYVLVPLVLRELEWEKMQALFMPVDEDSLAITLTSFAVQAVLLTALCVWRMRRSHVEHAA